MPSRSPCPPALCPGERDAEAWLTWEHQCLASCAVHTGGWEVGWEGVAPLPSQAPAGCRLRLEAPRQALCAPPSAARTWGRGNQRSTIRQQVRAAKVWCLPPPCPGCVPAGLGRVPDPCLAWGEWWGGTEWDTEETETPCSPRPAAHWDWEGHAFRPSSVGLPREGGAGNRPRAPHLTRVQGNGLGPMDLVAPSP